MDTTCVHRADCFGCCGPSVIFSQKSRTLGGLGAEVEDIRAAPASLHGAKVCGACGQPCYVCCCSVTVLHRIDDGELFIERYEHALANAEEASMLPKQKVVFANIDSTGFCGFPKDGSTKGATAVANAKTEHSAAADAPEPEPDPPDPPTGGPEPGAGP